MLCYFFEQFKTSVHIFSTLKTLNQLPLFFYFFFKTTKLISFDVDFKDEYIGLKIIKFKSLDQ